MSDILSSGALTELPYLAWASFLASSCHSKPRRESQHRFLAQARILRSIVALRGSKHPWICCGSKGLWKAQHLRATLPEDALAPRPLFSARVTRKLEEKRTCGPPRCLCLSALTFSVVVPFKVSLCLKRAGRGSHLPPTGPIPGVIFVWE